MKINKPLFRAPCNITTNNIMEICLGTKDKIICVRYKCGKIKWKENGYKKIRRRKNE